MTKGVHIMLKKVLALASAAATAATIAALGATTPVLAEGAQFPSPNASCMGWLAEASNPNASGDHIALLAQNGGASTLARVSPTGGGFPGLISCVVQIP
jgi:transcription elongation factor